MSTTTEIPPGVAPMADTVAPANPFHRHTRRCWWNHDLARWVCPAPDRTQK